MLSSVRPWSSFGVRISLCISYQMHQHLFCKRVESLFDTVHASLGCAEWLQRDILALWSFWFSSLVSARWTLQTHHKNRGKLHLLNIAKVNLTKSGLQSKQFGEKKKKGLAKNYILQSINKGDLVHEIKLHFVILFLKGTTIFLY